MLPADQRLKTFDLVRLGVDDRLEMHFQLFIRKRITKVGFDLRAAPGFVLQIASEKAITTTSASLGGIECQIGRVHQIFGLNPVVRGYCDPHRCSDNPSYSIDPIRSSEKR